jgi:hypothetical protein
MVRPALALRLVALLALAAVIGIGAGCAGTGSPWTKTVRVTVLQPTTDGTGEIPVTGATVTVSEIAATGGGTSTNSQTQGTDPNGEALFALEPGSYRVAVTMTGFTAMQVTVEVGYFAGDQVRTIHLVPAA